MQIFISRGGQQFGPYDEVTVRTQLAAGGLTPADMAWHEGAAGWQPLGSMPEFAAAGGGVGAPPALPPGAGMSPAVSQPGRPIEHRIIGTTLPVLELQMKPGDSVIAVSGELSWMGQSIAMQTSTAIGGGASGGLFGALKRVAGGGSLFMTEYSAQGAPGILAFATRVPGHILPLEVHPGEVYMIHRHGFLCATRGVELGVGFQQSLGAGIFGGDGFLLQKLSGHCQAWIELDGEVVPYTLAAGETLRVHPGHVGMFDASVRFEITRIKGIKNMLFGGDGIFLAALTGPGRVWLQSLPLSNLAHALRPYLGGSGESAGAAGIGGVIGSAIRIAGK